MGNTEGGRLSRSIHKQIYFNQRPAVLELCSQTSRTSRTSRTTLSTEITPSESSRYAMNPCKEIVIGESTPRITYQAGVSQEQINMLLSALSSKKNFSGEGESLSTRFGEGYTPAFSSIIPPVPVCPPLAAPPLPPMIPGVDPRKCTNSIY